MDFSSVQQLTAFLYCTVGGVAIGFIFDLFRVYRSVKKPSTASVFVQDILLFIILAVTVFVIMLIANNSEVRFFEFFAIFIGASVYMLSLSNVIRTGLVFIINVIKKCLYFILRIIFYPVRITLRLLNKPFKIVTIRIGHFKSRFFYKMKSLWQKIIKNCRNFYKILKKV